MGLPILIIDGTTLSTMPTEHGWRPTPEIGVGGAGNILLTAVWTYELTWDALDVVSFKEVYDMWFDNQSQDITVQLPELGADPYALKSYTARMNPVAFRGFFEGHYMGVVAQLIGIDITT